MKKIILLMPLFLIAENFTDLKQDILNSFNYKIAKSKVELYKQKLKQLNSKNYGSLSINYQGIYFFKQPYVNTQTPVAVVNNQLVYKNIEVNTADKMHYIGEIKYSFPIFNSTLNNGVTKSKLEVIKNRLNVENVKRIVFLNSLKLYSAIYATNENIKALKVAKQALIDSKEKAKALYDSGLLDKSNYDDINAKYYEIVAQIEDIKSQKNALLSQLSYLLNKKVTNIAGIEIDNKLITPNFQNRPDVKIIKENLHIANQDIKLVKSTYYPEIGVQIGLKREGDNFVLSKNDYSNIDKSYIALGVSYSFDGSKKHQLEAAKIAKNINLMFYTDYLNKIKSEYNSDLNRKKALFYQLKALKEEIKARKSYYSYIKSKFDEGLADSTDLNNAIAKLAQSQAQKEYIKSQIFFLLEKLKINGGIDVFSK